MSGLCSAAIFRHHISLRSFSAKYYHRPEAGRAVTVGVQLNVEAVVGYFGNLLRVHELQDTFRSQFGMIQSENPGELLRKLILLRTRKVFFLGEIQECPHDLVAA